MMAAMNSSGVKISKFFLFLPMSHAGPIENLAGILDIGDPGSWSGTSLLLGESISQDIFCQPLLLLPIVAGYAIPGMHAESAVMPAHEFFDELVVYLALTLQHGQDLGTEDLFELFQVSFGEAIEGPVGAKQPVGDNGMKMGMKLGVIAEGVDHHDHPQDAVIEAQRLPKEHLDAFLGTVA